MKVLVSDNLSASGVEILKKESGIEVDVKTGLSKEELITIIPEYDGLIVPLSYTHLRANETKANRLVPHLE